MTTKRQFYFRSGSDIHIAGCSLNKKHVKYMGIQFRTPRLRTALQTLPCRLYGLGKPALCISSPGSSIFQLPLSYPPTPLHAYALKLQNNVDLSLLLSTFIWTLSCTCFLLHIRVFLHQKWQISSSKQYVSNEDIWFLLITSFRINYSLQSKWLNILISVYNMFQYCVWKLHIKFATFVTISICSQFNYKSFDTNNILLQQNQYHSLLDVYL